MEQEAWKLRHDVANPESLGLMLSNITKISNTLTPIWTFSKQVSLHGILPKTLAADHRTLNDHKKFFNFSKRLPCLIYKDLSQNLYTECMFSTRSGSIFPFLKIWQCDRFQWANKMRICPGYNLKSKGNISSGFII